MKMTFVVTIDTTEESVRVKEQSPIHRWEPRQSLSNWNAVHCKALRLVPELLSPIICWESAELP